MQRKVSILCMILLVVSICGSYQTTVYAESVYGTHLIQTTDYQDEYEGALHLGLLEITAQQGQDVDWVAENVLPCIVRIHCGDSVGSGIVLALTTENVVIVSNAHLLQNDVHCDVDFYQGFSARGEIVSYSQQYDMAFAKVPLYNIPQMQWENLKYADKNMDYEQIIEGDSVIQIGSSASVAADCYIGGILQKEQYISDYGMEMMKNSCQAYVGMSGGGVFNANGYLIGMITAGTLREDSRIQGSDITYAIPINHIMEEMYSVISCF